MTVRRATTSDLHALLPVHSAAFDGQLGPLFGRRYLLSFLRWFIEHPAAVSLVATQHDALDGYVFGAPDGYGRHLGPEIRPWVALGFLRHWPRIVVHPTFRRKLVMLGKHTLLKSAGPSPIFEATPRGCFCLVGIGTARASRGRGVGRQLIEAFCASVPDRDIILDVYRDNAAARGLYERTGFAVLAEDGRVVRMIRRPQR